MVQDEPKAGDNVYKIENVNLILDKKLEKNAEHIDIDYRIYGKGEDFVIVTHF